MRSIAKHCAGETNCTVYIERRRNAHGILSGISEGKDT
jgi:hypothetical protein